MEPTKVSLPRRMLQCLKQCVDCNTANRFTAINRYVKILLISSVISIPSFAMAHHEYAAGQSDDRYASFEELKQNEDPSDYRIATKQAYSTMLIMAIHGEESNREQAKSQMNCHTRILCICLKD